MTDRYFYRGREAGDTDPLSPHEDIGVRASWALIRLLPKQSNPKCHVLDEMIRL